MFTDEEKKIIESYGFMYNDINETYRMGKYIIKIVNSRYIFSRSISENEYLTFSELKNNLDLYFNAHTF